MEETEVSFKRGSTSYINGIPVVDGQILYNTTTGEHFLDVSGRRIPVGGKTGTTDHTQLINRNSPDQHSISSITGLQANLTNLQSNIDGKQPKGNYALKTDKLANPNALTFTGASTGTYDGSKALTINIPSGGGVAKEEVFFAKYGKTTLKEIIQAKEANKIVVCDSSDNIYVHYLAFAYDSGAGFTAVTATAGTGTNISYVRVDAENNWSVPKEFDIRLDTSSLTNSNSYIPTSAFMKTLLNSYAKTSELPKKLPNPSSLKFTGASTATYDGSGEITVNIPSGSAYTLPTATASKLGGIKADPAQDNDTQPVRINSSGKLVTAPTGGSGGTTDHSALSNRNLPNQHTIAAITDLQSVLDGKQAKGSYVTESEFTQELSGKQPKGDYATKTELTSGLSKKQDTGDYATKTELTSGLNGKQPKGEYATKTELSQGLAGKQNTGDYATKADVTSMINSAIGDAIGRSY